MRHAKDQTEATFESFPSDDRDTYRALKNALTELGEAVKGLPREVTERNPAVDWRGMAGLRDIVTHQYFRLDMQRLWPVVHDEMPALVKVVAQEIALLPPTDEGDPGTGYTG